MRATTGVHDLDLRALGLGGLCRHTSRTRFRPGGKYFTDDEKEFPTRNKSRRIQRRRQAGSPAMLIYEQRLWSTNYPHNCDSGAEVLRHERAIVSSAVVETCRS